MHGQWQASKMIRNKFSSPGLKNTLTIATGAILGQLITIAAMPVVTRLYAPADMGVYATFIACIGLLATVFALHYELAIPLPKSESQSRLVTKLALLVVCILGAITFAFTMFLGKPLLNTFGMVDLIPIRVFIPLGMMASGLLVVLTYRSIRLRTFRLAATAKLLQGCIQPLTQIVYGVMGFGATGLVYGTLIGQCAAFCALAQNGFRQDIMHSTSVRITRLLVVARKFIRFPAFSAPSSLINAIVAQLPVLLLAAWFDIRVVGLYALSVRILQVPMRFIGDSLSQVFFSIAAEAHRNGSLGSVVKNMWRVQTTFALHSFVPLAMVAPELFGTVFGQEWREAGVYTQLIMPWIMVSFVSTSLSILVTVLQKQKQEFLFQLVYLSLLPGTLWLGHGETSEYLAMGLLGSAASVLLTGKIIWLLHIARVDLVAQAIWLLWEVLYVAFVAAVLLVMKTLGGTEVLMVFAAAILVLFTHGVNHLVRKAYVF